MFPSQKSSGDLDNIRSSYDTIASEYSIRIYNELKDKPFDRELLDRFADRVRGKGEVWDFGCGPGQVGRYLFDRGVNVGGVDLSPAMIAEAQRLNPGMKFRTGNMLALDFPDNSLAAIVAFYAIVNLTLPQIAQAFVEMHRVLSNGGLLLLAFHVGNETQPEVELWGQKISMDFSLLDPGEISRMLEDAGFEIEEVIEREPYPEVEYPSRRAYLVAGKSHRSG